MSSTSDGDSDHLDAYLEFLSRNILPKKPYILSIQSNLPFRLSPAQRERWIAGSPFDKDEEELQYVSFLKRDSDDDSILVSRADWGQAMENGRVNEHGNGIRSGTTTPLGASGNAAPKKITLSDYKTKAMGGATTSTNKE